MFESGMRNQDLSSSARLDSPAGCPHMAGAVDRIGFHRIFCCRLGDAMVGAVGFEPTTSTV